MNNREYTSTYHNTSTSLAVVGFGGPTAELLGTVANSAAAEALIQDALRPWDGYIDNSPWYAIDVLAPGESKSVAMTRPPTAITEEKFAAFWAQFQEPAA